MAALGAQYWQMKGRSWMQKRLRQSPSGDKDSVRAMGGSQSPPVLCNYFQCPLYSPLVSPSAL